MTMQSFFRKQSDTDARAMPWRALLDIVLPISLIFLVIYLLWPGFGVTALVSTVAASILSALLGVFLTRRAAQSGKNEQAVAIQGFERTYTPEEMRNARSSGRDALTGLPDTFAMLDFGAPLLVQEKPRLLAVIELSWLAEFNVRYGREKGDQALKSVARLLEKSLLDREMAARCRGGQFALLLESDSVGESFRRLSGIEETITNHIKQTFEIDTQAHLGLAWYPRHGLNMSTLLHRARIALTSAEASDQRCVIYSPASDTGLELERDLTSDLVSALDRNELILNYQPILPLDETGSFTLEVLTRWEHRDWGLISPETFIALAERGGFINRLTRYVINTAVAQLSAWRGSGVFTQLAINLSPNDLFDDTLPAFLSRTCEAAGVPASCLVLEVTETAMISDVARARHTLKRLRRLGVRVLIDDFGTGFSSLAHLRHLPIDGIKIDKSFVTSLRRGSSDSTIVRVSIELAHSLGLRVTAEGVESEYIESRLEEFQCDALQGYHICPPIPADAVIGWLLGNDHSARASRLRQQRLPLPELLVENRI